MTNKYTEIINNRDKETACKLISKIDSGEARLFSERVNKDLFVQKFFADNEDVGIFFSFSFHDALRIHIAFENDSQNHISELTELINISRKRAGSIPVAIWLRNENRKLLVTYKRSLTSMCRVIIIVIMNPPNMSCGEKIYIKSKIINL